MSSLLDPLDDPQRRLVDIVWAQFAATGKFPGYHYVEYRMRRLGHNAEAVLRSFPLVGHHLVPSGYRTVTWWSTGSASDRGGPVTLTIAGLHHIDDDRASSFSACPSWTDHRWTAPACSPYL